MWQIIQFLMSLPRLYSMVKEILAALEKVKAEKKQKELEKAAEAMKGAKSEKEQKDALRSIVDNSF